MCAGWDVIKNYLSHINCHIPLIRCFLFLTTTCHFGKIRIIFHFSVTFYTKSDSQKRVSLAVVIEVT